MKSFKLIKYLSIMPLFKKNFSVKMDSPNNNFFINGIYSQPHPDKIEKGGEDSHFSSENILSVADGVGGWNSQGVDPAIYSNKLTYNISKLIENPLKLLDYIKNPKSLLIDSADLNKEKGSSTLVILSLEKEKNILRSSFIGDSGYLILRPLENSDFEIIHKSQEQQHSFNFPYQIGSIGDNPSKALQFEHKNIKNNDIVILGTDGWFDNINEFQIKDYLKNYSLKNNKIDPKDFSQKLGEHVFKLSLNKSHISPFSINAQKNFFNYKGGKSDDITIIVGICKILNN